MRRVRRELVEGGGQLPTALEYSALAVDVLGHLRVPGMLWDDMEVAAAEHEVRDEELPLDNGGGVGDVGGVRGTAGGQGEERGDRDARGAVHDSTVIVGVIDQVDGTAYDSDLDDIGQWSDEDAQDGAGQDAARARSVHFLLCDCFGESLGGVILRFLLHQPADFDEAGAFVPRTRGMRCISWPSLDAFWRFASAKRPTDKPEWGPGWRTWPNGPFGPALELPDNWPHGVVPGSLDDMVFAVRYRATNSNLRVAPRPIAVVRGAESNLIDIYLLQLVGLGDRNDSRSGPGWLFIDADGTHFQRVGRRINTGAVCDMDGECLHGRAGLNQLEAARCERNDDFFDPDVVDWLHHHDPGNWALNLRRVCLCKSTYGTQAFLASRRLDNILCSTCLNEANAWDGTHFEHFEQERPNEWTPDFSRWNTDEGVYTRRAGILGTGIHPTAHTREETIAIDAFTHTGPLQRCNDPVRFSQGRSHPYPGRWRVGTGQLPRIIDFDERFTHPEARAIRRDTPANNPSGIPPRPTYPTPPLPSAIEYTRRVPRAVGALSRA